MFWRIVKQLFRASRGRLVIALMAVISGAAVTTALLNLQMDASKKLSAEFRTLGANVLVLPRTSMSATTKSSGAAGDVMAAPLEDEAVISRVASTAPGAGATAAPYLFIVADTRASSGTAPTASSESVPLRSNLPQPLSKLLLRERGSMNRRRWHHGGKFPVRRLQAATTQVIAWWGSPSRNHFLSFPEARSNFTTPAR